MLAVGGCAAPGDEDGPGGSAPAPADRATAAASSAARVRSNVRSGATQVDLDQQLRLRAVQGTFEDLDVTTAKGDPPRGTLNPERTLWTSSGQVRQDTRYRVRGSAVDADGVATAYRGRFATRALTYRKPGTEVTVRADVGGVPAGNGSYGQLDRTVGFTVHPRRHDLDDVKHAMRRTYSGEFLHAARGRSPARATPTSATAAPA